MCGMKRLSPIEIIAALNGIERGQHTSRCGANNVEPVEIEPRDWTRVERGASSCVVALCLSTVVKNSDAVNDRRPAGCELKGRNLSAQSEMEVRNFGNVLDAPRRSGTPHESTAAS